MSGLNVCSNSNIASCPVATSRTQRHRACVDRAGRLSQGKSYTGGAFRVQNNRAQVKP